MNACRVALVNLPQAVPELMYTEKVRRAYTDVAQILPNLSLAYLAGALEREGFDVNYIEAFALKMSPRDIAEELVRFRPAAVCYNLITESFLDVLPSIAAVRERYPLPVIVGGMHMGIYPRETLSHSCIDYGIVGEGWESLPALLRALEEGSGDLEHVNGLIHRRNGAVRETPRRDRGTSLEEVPFPARHLLPNHAYRCVMSKRRPITVMISSYGCPFKCAYCDVGSITYQMRSAGHVIDEIEECYRRHGIREIWFQDETFTLSPDRVFAICDAIRTRGIDVLWSVRTRADLVNPEMLKAMHQAGCFKIHMGVESGDAEVLRMLSRSIPLERIRAAFAWAREAGISTLAFFMIGNPGEDRVSLERTIRFAKSLSCDFIQVNKLTPCPPSRLYSQVMEETGRDFWAEYTRGRRESIAEMGNYFSVFPADELDRWQKRFFKSFYCRPSYVARRLLSVRSWHEFQMLAKAAGSIW
ncbi:MAG: radical SAM protein [bacterium]|nr:radical SAM protein [bacterium]